MRKQGFVTILGAGTSFSLLTLAGKRAIEAADVLLYDALLDPRLLDLARADCETRSVGKRAGAHSLPQEEINALLIQYARAGKHVVRVKGGDPFVFGRGSEEALALEEAGISYTAIPGVSAAVAVPARFGLPVTHRGLSRSFTVITAHPAGEEALPFETYVKLGGTLLFLMAGRRIAEIAKGLTDAGMDASTPAAILVDGYGREERRVDGTLETIRSEKIEHSGPVMLVIGETARFHLNAKKRPRVVLTGTEGFVSRLSDALVGCELEIIEQPNLSIEPLPVTLPEALPTWLVFTSRNGVALFFAALKRERRDLRTLSNAKFACIGPGTAAALEAHGLFPELVPELPTGRALGEALNLAMEAGESALLCRAAEGNDELPEILRSSGSAVTELPLYQTVLLNVSEYADLTNVAAVIFGSASGVRAFFSSGKHLPEETLPICIGPTAAAELEKYVKREPLMPAHYSLEGLRSLLQNLNIS